MPTGRAVSEVVEAPVTGGEDHLGAAVGAFGRGGHGGDKFVDGAALEAEAGRQVGHLGVAPPEEGVELGLLLGAELVAVESRAGLGPGQGAPVEVEGPGQGVELGVGGDSIRAPASQAWTNVM
jgi:hypothetical protein